MFNNYLHIFAKTFVGKRHGFKTKHHSIHASSIHSSSNIYFCLLCARHWDKGWRYIGEQKRHDLCSYGSYSTSVLDFEAVMKNNAENVFRHQWNWVTGHVEGGWSRRMGEGWTETHPVRWTLYHSSISRIEVTRLDPLRFWFSRALSWRLPWPLAKLDRVSSVGSQGAKPEPGAAEMSGKEFRLVASCRGKVKYKMRKRSHSASWT